MRNLHFKTGEHLSIDNLLFRDLMELLNNVYLFAGMGSAEIKDTCEQLSLFQYQDEQILIKQGDPGRFFFIIYSGEVKVRIKSGWLRKSVDVVRLKKGSILGEMALIADEPCTASVIAVGPVKVFVGDKDLFNKLIHHNAEFSRNITQIVSGRDNLDVATKLIEIQKEAGIVSAEETDSEEEAETEVDHGDFRPRKLRELDIDASVRSTVIDILEKHDLFTTLNKEELQKLGECLERYEFPTGEYLIRQGFKVPGIYLIHSGKVQVRVCEDPQELSEFREVARLYQGDVFGEMSAVLSEPAVASIVALENVEAFIIPRPVFKDFLDENQDFSAAAYAIAFERR